MTTRARIWALLPGTLRRLLRSPWVTTIPKMPHPYPLTDFRFYALIGTWMEADIIKATVANAFAQGVERVFLIDNNSPDDTAAKAREAGAEVALIYSTDQYDEQYRLRLMNEFVQFESRHADVDHIWWLWLDADEFPRPEDGGTLRALLAGLDQNVRVVGSRFLNHYPTPNQVAYVEGRHPLDFQPLCEEISVDMCARGHRKHPLLRWDRGGPVITQGVGFHVAHCEYRPLLEARESIVTHHFPFRQRDATLRRLTQLWAASEASKPRARDGDIAVSHMKLRMQSLNAVYSGDWANTLTLGGEHPKTGVSLVDWQRIRPSVSPDVRRWY